MILKRYVALVAIASLTAAVIVTVHVHPMAKGEQSAQPNQNQNKTAKGAKKSVTDLPKTEEHQCQTENKLGYWQKVFGPDTLPNWALVSIGLVAALIALCTLWQIKRQVIAGEDALLLDLALRRQWIYLANWTISFEEGPPPKATILFDICNKTQSFVTLHLMEILVDGVKNSGDGIMHMLLPGSPYAGIATVKLTEAQALDYAKMSLSFSLTISILFADAAEDQWGQRFETVMTLGPGHTIVHDTRNKMWDSSVGRTNKWTRYYQRKGRKKDHKG